MSRRYRSAMTRSLGGAAAIALSALVPAHAETASPDRITYDVKVSEDRVTKVCMLGVAVKDQAAGETVRFQVVVARTKRDDVLAGPAVFGFTIEVYDLRLTAERRPQAHAIEITSAAFASDRYTAAARPRTAPFADGSWVASTLDPAEGGALVDAAVEGKFQIAYTRTRPIAARTFEVASAPPLEVLWRFNGCIEGLQAIE
jgi:hypothetical protein